MATIRVGVTGLSRAGKSVFLTSAIYNLLATTGKYLPLFVSQNVRYHGAELPLSNSAKSFHYDDNIYRLRKAPPEWPEPTRDITEFKLSVTFTKDRGVKGPHELTFVDYPGEQLLDAGLTQKNYAKWSDDILGRLTRAGEPMSAALAAFSESTATILADTSESNKNAKTGTSYLILCRKACSEGIATTPAHPLFASDDDGDGSVEMPFVPLDQGMREAHPALLGQMETRYKVYVANIVSPFLSRIGTCTHQIVLVDILDILRRGPQHHNRVRQELG